LRPFFSPIGGVRPNAFPRQRRLPHGSVDALPTPRDTFHLVVLGQTCSPELEKEALSLPPLKMPVDGAGRAKFAGQGLPLATGAQYIHDGREDLTRLHGLATCSGFALIGLPLRTLPYWNQGFYLAPKGIRYGPRFDLSHLFYGPADRSWKTGMIWRGYLPLHYLRIIS
jgi:hypothetical protein